MMNRKESRACVYRFYDSSDTLLYVGCTINGQRLDNHRTGSPWFTEAARVTIEHFEAWSDAELAELIAIKREFPKYNVASGRDTQAAKRAVREARALAAATPLPVPTDQISTAEAMVLLGYTDRSTVIRMVREHRLAPSRKMPGRTGAYLFWRHDVVRLAAEIASTKTVQVA